MREEGATPPKAKIGVFVTSKIGKKNLKTED